MSEKPKYTEMGTRILMTKSGATLVVTNDESGQSRLSLSHHGETVFRVEMGPHETLSLAEFLIVAAKPNSGKEVIDMRDLPDTLPAPPNE